MRRVVPTPLNGWRAFLGEVGIIVLGVLLALGAQQAVEEWTWRREVADLRATIRAEIARNLWTYPYRAQQKPCISRRIDELEQWLADARAGRMRTLVRPIGTPLSLVIRTSAWDGRDAATMAHMPRDERLGYGLFYSEFANNEVHRLDERDAWIALNSYNGATMLDHQDQVRVQGLLFRARLRDSRIDSNAARFIELAVKNGLKPTAETQLVPLEEDFCRSLLSEANDGNPVALAPLQMN